MSQRRKKPNYTRAFEWNAAKLVLKTVTLVGAIAQHLGIAGFKKTHRADLHWSTEPKPNESNMSCNEPEDGIRRLRKKQWLQMEREAFKEVLKKAAAFFTKGSN